MKSKHAMERRLSGLCFLIWAFKRRSNYSAWKKISDLKDKSLEGESS